MIAESHRGGAVDRDVEGRARGVGARGPSVDREGVDGCGVHHDAVLGIPMVAGVVVHPEVDRLGAVSRVGGPVQVRAVDPGRPTR